VSEYDTAVAVEKATQIDDSDPQSFRSETLRRAWGRRASRSNEWSSSDLTRLRELAAIGQPLEAIAATLRRTASAVRNKAGMHGISLRPRR
jgi:hypothetical protein